MGDVKTMKDRLIIHEQGKEIKITIRSETIKPIITAIKSYDPKFNINKFDKDNKISLDVLHLLVQNYQEYLEYLIENNVPSHYHNANDGIDNTDGTALEYND